MVFKKIGKSNKWHKLAYGAFGLIVLIIMFYYLSNTISHYTTDRQFPINSFERFPLSILIFPVELFSFLFALYFVYVLFTGNYYETPNKSLPNRDKTRVAILIPAHNEPIDILERTILASKRLKWKGGVSVYLLDDSDNPQDIKNTAFIASQQGINVVRRKDRVGFKAGNINNALRSHIKEDFFVILDSDQAPREEMLEKTMDYFSDNDVAFVQTPQHFVDIETPLEVAIQTGTNIFYRVQCVSKSRDSAIPFCGTNAVFRTSAFKEVKGLSYYTATEDIELGMRINEAGYRGVYVPDVLVDGYAPKDFKAYSSQQYRWANGNLAILRESFFRLLKGNFSFPYQVHMFFTIAWWIVGLTTLLYIFIPILALVFGIGTHHTWLPDVLIFFIFFGVLFGIFMIFASLHAKSDGEKVRLRDALLQYSLLVNSSFIYVRAAINSLLFKRYIGFVTTKKKASSSSLWLIKWNLILGGICFLLGLYALYNSIIAANHDQLRTYLPLSLWLLFYGVVLFSSILFVGAKKND